MRHPQRVRLDFAAPVHSAPIAGALLAVAGAAVAIAVGTAFSVELEERARLDGELARISRPHRAPTAAATKSAEEAAAVERELSVPWSALLTELENASHDSATRISVLGIEPDVAKHSVRITAEARTLADALAYLERLQQSRLLRYPMLESHERRKDDPEHPVRIKLAAEWRT